MATEWWEWWNTPMNAYNGATPANIFSLETFEDPHEQIAGELCPHALFGEDKDGNPIYWYGTHFVLLFSISILPYLSWSQSNVRLIIREKTGLAEANMPKIREYFDMDYLMARHVRQQTIMLLRLQYCSKKYSKEITKLIVVFDLEGLSSFPDLFALDYVRRVLALDQAYYPERLGTIYLVNAPWYFAAIYSMITPFLDAVTAKKVQILGTDYFSTLNLQIDESVIPTSMGGTCETMQWNWPYSEDSGVSPQQLRAYLGSLPLPLSS
jgi:hypothetical protein